MVDLTREMIAYAIIGAIIIVAAPTGMAYLRRRKRDRLRRRGIKTYGH
jgi:hypothetical protein